MVVVVLSFLFLFLFLFCFVFKILNLVFPSGKTLTINKPETLSSVRF